MHAAVAGRVQTQTESDLKKHSPPLPSTLLHPPLLHELLPLLPRLVRSACHALLGTLCRLLGFVLDCVGSIAHALLHIVIGMFDLLNKGLIAAGLLLCVLGGRGYVCVSESSGSASWVKHRHCFGRATSQPHLLGPDHGGAAQAPCQGDIGGAKGGEGAHVCWLQGSSGYQVHARVAGPRAGD
jgi:hypothetical protein